jgi:hypothetical protein
MSPHIKNSQEDKEEKSLVNPDISEERITSIVRVMGAILFSETSVLTGATRRNIPEYGILHTHRRENLKSYVVLTGWCLQRRRNVFPVKYELGSYIPEDDIPHSHRRENHKSYIVFILSASPM